MSTSKPAADSMPDQKVSTRPQRHPCLLCQQRKVKCDRNSPCSNCVKARGECVAPNANLPAKKRKRRFPEAELLARLRRYEAYFVENGLDLDAVGRSALDPHEKSSAEAITRYAGPSVSVERSPRSLHNGNLLNDQFRDTEEILQGSSDDDVTEAPVTKAFDSRDAAAEYQLIFGDHNKKDMADLHPSPLHIFRLWQIYLDNVNPLVRILHAPTVQQQILDASADLGRAAENTEALMFGVYCMAIASTSNEDCHAFFGKERELLLAQYHAGARKALINAGLLGSSDLVVLQAFALYLLSNCQGASNPRSLVCLTGIAMRIAQRMGLDNDGTTLGLAPFEAEMRRRLWWQLLILDSRVAEISGSPGSITSYSWSTHLPSNVNDNDLFTGMRNGPTESGGLTEMLFFSLQCEIFEFTKKFRATSGSPTSTKIKAIDAFEGHLESKHLQHCDPSAPIHSLSILTARLGMQKLRSSIFTSRMAPESRRQMPPNEKDVAFSASLGALESHNAMLSAANTRRFVWHALTNPPFQAYLYLLCELRTAARTTEGGDMADRAWNQLAKHAESRRRHSSWDQAGKSSWIRLAIARLTVKAWEAREGGGARRHPVPRFISELRHGLAAERGQIGGDVGSLGGGGFDFFENGGMTGLDSGLDALFPAFVPGPGDASLTEWPIYDDFMQGDAVARGETHDFEQGAGSM